MTFWKRIEKHYQDAIQNLLETMAKPYFPSLNYEKVAKFWTKTASLIAKTLSALFLLWFFTNYLPGLGISDQTIMISLLLGIVLMLRSIDDHIKEQNI